MSEFYSASDYAGLSGGGFSFYYGYETALCQAEDFNDDDRNEHTEAWRFEVTRNGKTLWSKTADDLGVGKYCHEPKHVLMCGIAKWLDAVKPKLDQIK